MDPQRGRDWKGGKEARLIDSLAATTDYPLPPETYPRPLPVTAIAAGNGDGLLVVGGYRELLVWRDIEKNADPERWQGFDVSVSAITITTAGDWIAVAHGSPGQRGEVRLARLTQVGLQDRSSVLLTASRDRTARVIRLQDGQSISNYAQHDRAVHGVCQSKAGTLTLDETGTLRLWAAGSRTPMRSRQRVSDVALGLHRYEDSVLVPSSGRIMRISVEQVEQEDGTDKDGKPKTRKVPKWKGLAPLEIDPADVIVSLAVAPDGAVSAGTQSGRIYRWLDGATASEPTAPLTPLVALPR